MTLPQHTQCLEWFLSRTV
uniref:Uncharacterized protein n=1 Tax=Anguilla anguilla TaxID=7936 RepID=A0A0E9VBG7_ANGAN